MIWRKWLVRLMVFSVLGGMAFNDLRLSRKDDPEKQEFLYVPSGIIYHDKEHLRDGRVAVRKIELLRPRLHIIRDKDGRLNVENVIGPVNLKERMPTIVIQQGTILFEDRTVS